MSNESPLDKSKVQFSSIIDKISSKESAVGIDAQLTHAIIIEYLQRIDARLLMVEKQLLAKK